MQNSLIFIVSIALLIHFSTEAKAKLKVDVKDKVNREADNRSNRATGRVIAAGFDKLEEGLKCDLRKM